MHYLHNINPLGKYPTWQWRAGRINWINWILTNAFPKLFRQKEYLYHLRLYDVIFSIRYFTPYHRHTFNCCFSTQ